MRLENATSPVLLWETCSIRILLGGEGEKVVVQEQSSRKKTKRRVVFVLEVVSVKSQKEEVGLMEPEDWEDPMGDGNVSATDGDGEGVQFNSDNRR